MDLDQELQAFQQKYTNLAQQSKSRSLEQHVYSQIAANRGHNIFSYTFPRSYIAPVSGLSGKREVRLHSLFDHASTALGEQFGPIDPAKVCQDIDKVIEMYT